MKTRTTSTVMRENEPVQPHRLQGVERLMATPFWLHTQRKRVRVERRRLFMGSVATLVLVLCLLLQYLDSHASMVQLREDGRTMQSRKTTVVVRPSVEIVGHDGSTMTDRLPYLSRVVNYLRTGMWNVTASLPDDDDDMFDPNTTVANKTL